MKKFILCRLLLAIIHVMAFSVPVLNADVTSSELLGGQFIYPEFSKKISMEFQDAGLNDVLKIFSQQSGMNFIASQNVIDRKISLYLDEVPVEEALERILNANNLTYEIQPGSDIFVVKPLDKSSRELVTRIYHLKNATVSSSKFNDTVQIGESSSGDTSGDSSASGIVAALKTVLTQFGTLVEDPRTNSVIVTDIPAQFPIIERTVARLDVQVPQILIEVEMLDVSKNTADLMGVKYGDTPLSFTGPQRSIYYPFNQNRLLDQGRIIFDAEDDDNAEFIAGRLDASGLSAVLQFLKTQTDTKNLARPRILTLNNETAEIKISTDEAIGVETVTSAQAEGADSTTSVEAERVETGVFLTVTPQVNLLTGDITLAVAPRVIQARTGATFSGPNGPVSFRDPEERGTKSILRVKDGDTIILGGLLRTDQSKTNSKLPVFGDIPILGAAFRHKDDSVTERELLIFITPRLLDNTAATRLSASENKRLIREQDVPSKRNKAIENDLIAIERRQRL